MLLSKIQNLTPKQIFLPLQNAGTFESFSSWIYNDFCVAYLKIFLMWKIGCYSSHVYDLQLSKVKSPKEDLAKELRTIKQQSRDKVDETIRQEEAELSATEDGTVPMPTEEEELGESQPTDSIVTFAETTTELETEEAVVKKLKRKKEKVEEEEGMKPLCNQKQTGFSNPQLLQLIF